MANAIKVLIIDDDKAAGAALSEIIRRIGFKPIVVTKPSDALNVVRLQTVHAAIVDVLLPKMTGVELVSEFRKTKFAENPVIFVSGVFKDKAFAAETIRKTGAVDFLFKPYSADDITNSLKKTLQNTVNAEKWSVQSLLTRKLTSSRERAKAIERLEEIQGLDFPFVLSIIMEAGGSGHLNIVNDTGEIFGVTLIKGTISEVDSTESQSTAVLSLISNGYLRQEDWDAFQASGLKKFSLENLVREGFVSPHAVSEARHEQIILDFRSICSAQTLQVNFVSQDYADEPPKHAVRLHEMMGLLEASLDDFFPEDYLRSFYSTVATSPMHLVEHEDGNMTPYEIKALKDLASLKEIAQKGGTLGQVLEALPEQEAKVYQSLHYLVLNRSVIFDDLNRAKNLNSMMERYKKLYGELQDKTPDKIFEYFGANANSNPNIIQGIFDEYAKSNHPDQLGKESTPELRTLCKKCFDLVDKAREILTDENKRSELFAQIKVQQAEKQARSQKLTNEGLDILRRGQAKEALAVLHEAEGLYTTSLLTFISIWAEVKAGIEDKVRLNALGKKLEAVTAEERRSAFFLMASGLVKKAQGDINGATLFFEKAVEADSQFVEARRELRSITNPEGNPSGEKNKKLDIFTGDITAVVSQIFRRKAD